MTYKRRTAVSYGSGCAVHQVPRRHGNELGLGGNAEASFVLPSPQPETTPSAGFGLEPGVRDDKPCPRLALNEREASILCLARIGRARCRSRSSSPT